MAHWRNTFRSPRFVFIDARVSMFLVGFLLHMRLWTLFLLLAVFVGFYWVERYGYDFMSALRALRSRIAGPIRPPLSPDRARGAIDYDRRPQR